MCDCLRSLPVSDFKWAAIEQKVITTDSNVVFSILQSLGHCAKDKLKQLTRFTTRRLDKALNPLLVYEKVVRVNGELVFVPLPPELEALVAAQAHATTDEEVEALCAAPAATDATSTESCAPTTEPEPCSNTKSESHAVAASQDNAAQDNTPSATNATATEPCAPTAEPEPCSDTKSESHAEAASHDSTAQDKASATSSDTVESSPATLTTNATSDNVVAETQDEPQAEAKPELAPAATSDTPAAPARASTAQVDNTSSLASQAAVAITETLATPVKQSSAATASNTVSNPEPVVSDIPVLQAEPIEPQASFAGQPAVTGQPVNMMFAAQCSQTQAMAYMATTQNTQGSVVMPPYQGSVPVTTNAPAQISAAMPINQGFASVPAFVPSAMPQQYQSQFAAQPAPYMPANGNYNPVGTKILGDHPQDIQEVVNYIYSLDPVEYAHILNDRSVDIKATAAKFYRYYANRDWFIGNAPIRSWTCALESAIAPGVCASNGKKNGWAIVNVDPRDEAKKRKTRTSMANQAQQSYSPAGNNSAATPAQPTGSAANGGDACNKKYDRLVLPPEWRNMDKNRRARLGAKLIELIGRSPQTKDFSTARDGSLNSDEAEVYEKAKREYNKKALESMTFLLDQYRNVPTDQI